MNRDKNLNESATSSEFEGNMKPTSEKFIENPKFKAAIEKSFKLNTEPIPEESEEEVSWNDAGFLRLKSIGINSVGSSVDVKVKVLYSLPIRTPRGYILKEFFVTDNSNTIPVKLVMWNQQAVKYQSLQSGDIIEIFNAYINYCYHKNCYEDDSEIQITVNEWKSKVKVYKKNRENKGGNFNYRVNPYQKHYSKVQKEYVGDSAPQCPISSQFQSCSKVTKQSIKEFTKGKIKDVLEIRTYFGCPLCKTSLSKGKCRKCLIPVTDPVEYYLSRYLISFSHQPPVKCVAFQSTGDIIGYPITSFHRLNISYIQASLVGKELKLKLKNSYKHDRSELIIEEIQ